MNEKNIVNLVQWVAERLKASGADECSVNYSRSKELEIEFRKGRIETLKRSVTNNLNISIYRDGRFSSHSTASLNRNDLEDFIKRGVEITSYLNIDKFRALPDPVYYEKKEDIELELYDDAINAVSMATKIDELKRIDNLISGSQKGIISSTIGYSDSNSESILLNSNGFLGKRKTTLFSKGAELTLMDKGDKLIEDYHYATVRNLEDMPQSEQIAESAINYAVRKRGQNKIKSGNYETIVENRVVGNLLRTLLSPLSGKLIYQGKSCFEDKLEKVIGPESLTILEDPFVKRGLGSRYFDNEGITSFPDKIVEKGVLKKFFIDSYYGRKSGKKITSGSYSNILIPAGEKSLGEMVKDIDKGILITGFIGGNFNSTTGDFSFGITGILIEQGELTGALNEMNITGNSFRLWQNFKEAANDVYKFSRILSPSLRFSEMLFSGS